MNDVLLEMEFLNENDQQIVKVVLDAGLDDDIMNIINGIDDYYVYPDIHDDYNLGHHYLYDENLPDYLSNYIDYKEYGRDSRMNELGSFTDYGYVKRVY